MVTDTDASVRFYQALLGLRVVGRSENYGTEHLNNVFGAHLRITGLRGLIGPGIEPLEYVTPRDGRTFPTDEHANDVVHIQTAFVSTDLNDTARELRDSKVFFVVWRSGAQKV